MNSSNVSTLSSPAQNIHCLLVILRMMSMTYNCITVLLRDTGQQGQLKVIILLEKFEAPRRAFILSTCTLQYVKYILAVQPIVTYNAMHMF